MAVVLLLSVAALCVAFVVASGSSLDVQWDAFKAKYQKQYGSVEEEAFRKEVFAKNLAFIDKFNKEKDSSVTYTVGINGVADLTLEEFTAKLQKTERGEIVEKDIEISEPIPASKDWRTTGCIPGVMNQGQCGGCWAYVAYEMARSYCCLAHNITEDLSLQELFDCTPGSQGCDGGMLGPPMHYCHTNGLESAASYPFTGQMGACKANESAVICHCPVAYQIPAGNETALTAALAFNGPVAAAIDASSTEFQMYTGGVFNYPKCGKSLDHILLLVGYGSMGGADMYIGQNTWGTSWGAQGFIYMSRDKDNQCGIADMAYYM